MDFWKLGTRWGSGMPNFYEWIKEKKIIISHLAAANPKKGDCFLVTDGFTVNALVCAADDFKKVTFLPEWEMEMQEEYGIEVDANLIYAPVVFWFELNENQRFTYPMRKGICQVHNSDIIAKANNLLDRLDMPTIHQKCFEKLEYLRISTPSLTYQLIDSPSNLEKGFCFDGNTLICKLSFWEGYSKNQQSPNIFIGIQLTTNEIYLSFTADPDQKDTISFFQKLFIPLKGVFQKEEFTWIKKYQEQNYLQVIELFIREEKEIIDSFLHKFNAENPKSNISVRFIDENVFNKKHAKTLSVEPFSKFIDIKPIEQKKEKENFFELNIVLKSVSLTHFRGFENEAKLEFHPELTVIIGDNGGGKTTLLDGTASLLHFLINAIRKRTQDKLEVFSDEDINNNATEATNIIEANFSEKFYNKEPENEANTLFEDAGLLEWFAALKRGEKGYEIGDTADDISFDKLLNSLDHLKYAIANNFRISVPIIMYYGCANTPKKYLPEFSKNSEYHLFSIYDDALDNNGFDFSRFYKWFEWEYKKSGQQIKNDSTLGVICRAVYDALSEESLEEKPSKYSDLYINYENRPEGELWVKKEGLPIRVNQLSSGEKQVFALIADLGMRLIIANPKSSEPLKGCGIVLIDEIDLHLHPNWQQAIIGTLRNTFPNIQWVVTTHSPQIVSNIHKEHIRILRKGQIVIPTEQTIGLDINTILHQTFGAKERSETYQEKITELFRFIEVENWEKSAQKLKELRDLWGENNPDVIRASNIIDYFSFESSNAPEDEIHS